MLQQKPYACMPEIDTFKSLVRIIEKESSN